MKLLLLSIFSRGAHSAVTVQPGVPGYRGRASSVHTPAHCTGTSAVHICLLGIGQNDALCFGAWEKGLRRLFQHGFKAIRVLWPCLGLLSTGKSDDAAAPLPRGDKKREAGATGRLPEDSVVLEGGHNALLSFRS